MATGCPARLAPRSRPTRGATLRGRSFRGSPPRQVAASAGGRLRESPRRRSTPSRVDASAGRRLSRSPCRRSTPRRVDSFAGREALISRGRGFSSLRLPLCRNFVSNARESPAQWKERAGLYPMPSIAPETARQRPRARAWTQRADGGGERGRRSEQATEGHRDSGACGRAGRREPAGGRAGRQEPAGRRVGRNRRADDSAEARGRAGGQVGVDLRAGGRSDPRYGTR